MDERFSTLDGDLMTEEALMMEEFNRLVKETAELDTEIEIPAAPAATIKPMELPKADGSLEESIQIYQQHRKEKLFSYLEEGKKKSIENCMLFLDSFCEADLLANRSSGGFFFSHDGFGVAVNPGKNFLKKFHECGRHISEIDAVVVTRDDQEDCQDLQAIYQLNLQCNSSSSEFHLIRYFLHPAIYRTMSARMKPQFKQERNSVISLDLFEDRETVELNGKMRLTFMNAEKNRESNLAVVFDLQTKKIGYFGKAPYSVDCLNMLNGCDLLILGFDETNHKDLMMHEQMDRSLGFMGVFNLCNELAPKAAFVVEHSGSVGDVRMEVAKRLKGMLAKENCSTVLFPVECGMMFDLNSMRVQGNNSEWIDMRSVRVIQPEGKFSSLHYISAEDIL